MKLIPLKNKVLVKKDEPEAKVGAIHVPDISQKEFRVRFGEVVKLGDLGVQSGSVVVGDRVVVPAWEKGHAVIVGEERYWLFEIDDVEAVVEQEAGEPN